jgi:sucrose-6-phosphate hydrolase SacC (GH32 family)
MMKSGTRWGWRLFDDSKLWPAGLLAVTTLYGADQLLFVYFKEPGNMGVFYAISDDGYNWKALNGGEPWIPVEHEGELMRDPFLARGPDHQFHLVWTWGLRGQSIGYATSPDLLNWSRQREIPLMAALPGTRNTWAPEIYWDKENEEWMIVFSSAVEGKHGGNRLYSARTRISARSASRRSSSTRDIR